LKFTVRHGSELGATMCALMLALTLLAGARAAEPASSSLDAIPSYLRATHETNGATALQVAMRCLKPAHGRGPDVWLAAVTHIGTSNYYAELQHFLDAQPRVFFEAIRADDDGVPRRGGEYSLQADLAKALGLTFQLDQINYHRPHFRNSDLTLEELTRLLSPATNAVSAPDGVPAEGAMEFGALVQAMTGEGLMGGLARLGVGILGASTRLQAATKVAMIELLGQLPNDLTQIAGLPPGMQKLMQILVEERNEAVVRDVRKALAQRPPLRSVAVFYGAGHMADLEQRLCRALGYRPANERWLTAFDVNPQEAGISQFELDFTTRLVRQQLQGLQRRPPANATNAPAASR
jgi:hypothetical protein